MKIDNSTNHGQILKELGQRLVNQRKRHNLTQASLAEQAGVSKRTVERMESGFSTQTSTLFKVMRVFDLLKNTEKLIPARQSSAKQSKPKPVDHLSETETDEDHSKKSRSWGY